MGLETGTTIASLNAAWPLGTDPRSQGDDHLRLVKAVVKNDAASRALTTVQTFAGPLRIGEIYIGANPAGTATPLLISGATGSSPNIRSGNTTGQLLNFSDSAAATVAFIGVGGTAASIAQIVMTREKGDFRYALKTTLLAALGALGPAVTPAGLRDAIVAALNTPPDLSGDDPLEA